VQNSEQPGKIKFILSITLFLFMPLLINYYALKYLITFFFGISWEYSLKELFGVSLVCSLFGLLFGMYVQSKRKMKGAKTE